MPPECSRRLVNSLSWAIDSAMALVLAARFHEVSLRDPAAAIRAYERAGAAGLHIQGTELLTRVASETEAVWAICAITQLYREEGWYLERTVHYVARVGMDHVRRRILEDAAGRQGLEGSLDLELSLVIGKARDLRAQTGRRRHVLEQLVD